MSPDRTPCTGQWRLFDAEDRGDVIQAKRLCARCPIRDTCLLDALRHELRAPVNMRQGVFGGMSREERHQIATQGTGHPDAYHLRHLALGLAPAGCAHCITAEHQVAA